MSVPQGPMEKKARADIRKLQPKYRTSAMAAAYIMAAAMLDEGVPAREFASVSREMRLAYAQLVDMGGTQKAGSFVDQARKNREERVQLHAVK